MAYNTDFYAQYRAYLREPQVREAHDFVFSIVRSNKFFNRVVDLGCGESNEFYQHARPSKYLGIDLHAAPHKGTKRSIHRGNYRDVSVVQDLTTSQTAFVSLFSTEITGTPQENKRLYEQLFCRCPFMYGLVSGFYYYNRKDKNPIRETGNIFSYQTLEAPEEVMSVTFTETRIVLPVPSQMFGRDVIEVWKLLKRN